MSSAAGWILIVVVGMLAISWLFTTDKIQKLNKQTEELRRNVVKLYLICQTLDKAKADKKDFTDEELDNLIGQIIKETK